MTTVFVPVLGAVLGLSCIALAGWLIRDELRRQYPDGHAGSHCARPELWLAVCPCGWESLPQPSKRDAAAAYDRHVLAELERIS